MLLPVENVDRIRFVPLLEDRGVLAGQSRWMPGGVSITICGEILTGGELARASRLEVIRQLAVVEACTIDVYNVAGVILDIPHGQPLILHGDDNSSQWCPVRTDKGDVCYQHMITDVKSMGRDRSHSRPLDCKRSPAVTPIRHPYHDRFAGNTE